MSKIFWQCFSMFLHIQFKGMYNYNISVFGDTANIWKWRGVKVRAQITNKDEMMKIVIKLIVFFLNPALIPSQRDQMSIKIMFQNLKRGMNGNLTFIHNFCSQLLSTTFVNKFCLQYSFASFVYNFCSKRMFTTHVHMSYLKLYSC